LRKTACIFFLAFLVAAPVCVAAESAPDILPLQDVKPGMRGVARTVFAGNQIESFDLEVLGILRDLMGPGQDIILVRLLGDKPNYTGVVAGMSGSPVYIEGKLVGALSLRFGAFTREPIGGVTPIENMFRAAQADSSRADAAGGEPEPRRYPLPADVSAAVGRSTADAYLVPIETPLGFAGFDPQVIRRFFDEFAAYGLVATPGSGRAALDNVSPLEPGGAVSAALVTGDMRIAGTCTISFRSGDQLYACGHPLLGYGNVQLPMVQSEIVATVPSEFASFKIANTGDVIGRFEQDRRSAIVGRLGPGPAMVPVELTLQRGGRTSRYNYEMFQHPKLSPLLFTFTLFNGLFSTIESGEEMTYRVRGRLSLRGHPDVVLDDLFSPNDSGIPDAYFVATSLGNAFRRVYSNPFETPDIEKVDLAIELLPERRAATIENAWTDRSEAAPGETLTVKVVLKPYRGERVIREVPVTIPAQAARGDLRILISDATLLNLITRTMMLGFGGFGGFGFGPRLTSLDQLIISINRERRNDRLYISLFQPTPTLLVEDKVLPSVPLSQMNVLNDQISSMRPGANLLFGESILDESSQPLDQVVSGSHWLRVTVR
jgi:hypothetical protein